MKEIKAGDIVLCIDMNYGYAVKAEVGKKYKVLDVCADVIYVKVRKYESMDFQAKHFKRISVNKLYKYLIL